MSDENVRSDVSKTITFLETKTDEEVVIYTLNAFRTMFGADLVLVGANHEIPVALAFLFREKYWVEQLLTAQQTLADLSYDENTLKTKEDKIDKYMDIWENTTQAERMLSAINLAARKLGVGAVVAHNPDQLADCFIVLQDANLAERMIKEAPTPYD